MKRIFLALIGLLLFVMSEAQDSTRHQIAIFTPLYLDSAFDVAGNFKYEKTGAKFVNPGLEFYYGAQLAIDSLQKRGAPLEIFVYDTRSKESIGQQLAKPELNDLELIIAESNV